MLKTIAVAGGAGYVGSHVCKALAQAGYVPLVLDNLSAGHAAAVKWGSFEHCDINDVDHIAELLARHQVSAVIHLAAKTSVKESYEDPSAYYENNVTATLRLLDAMRRSGVKHFVFSSSAAVYGNPLEVPIPETHPQQPINPYGKTKAMVEAILTDFDAAYGLRFIALRYFNAAGADPDGEIGELHHPETHLIPLILEVAAGDKPELAVFGDDYPTADGTCVRDFIHVSDIAQAHVQALSRLEHGSASASYNLGNGAGFSIKEVLQTAEQVTGRKIKIRVAARRLGDPPILVSDSQRAKQELAWEPRYSALAVQVTHAWAWYQKQHSS